MWKRLQQKWNVTPLRLFWILCVFAITGTLTAFISKSITLWLGFTANTHWGWKWGSRLFVLLIGYQLILLSVAFLLGQFPFFWQFEKKILQRLRLMKQPAMSNEVSTIDNRESGIGNEQIPNLKTQNSNSKLQLAIFASGAGTNAQKIIEHFKGHPSIQVSLIVSNKPGAGVLSIAEKEGLPALLIEKNTFFETDSYVKQLKEWGIHFVVLAGFLWKIPQALIAAYPQGIINIHPALLPKYGGKGMYGANVHAAVIAAGEAESGITIHYVDEHYDNGDIIFQATCPVLPDDTPDVLANRIHQLEHRHFPIVIENILLGKK